MAKFPFAVVAIDVGVMPTDKIPRMVVSDEDKVYQYKIVGTKLEARSIPQSPDVDLTAVRRVGQSRHP